MEKKGNIELKERRRIAEVHTESGSEYSLPDYERDVRKILYTSASVQPAGRFVGNDEVAFSGIIVYNLVYIDPEGQLSSLSFTSDYDYSVKCSPDTTPEAYATTRVSGFAVRLIGPRRVSARASVVGSVSLVSVRELDITGNGFDMKTPPVIKEAEIKVRSSRFGEGEEREYAESLATLEGAILDEVEVVSSDAACTIESTSVKDGSAEIRAELVMSALIKNGEEPAYPVIKRIPLTHVVEIAGISETDAVIPHLSVGSVSTSVNPTENGCEVVMSVITDGGAVCEYNEKATVTTDAYLTDYPSEAEYETLSYTELYSVTREEWKEESSVKKSELEAERPREILFVKATPKAESVKCTPKGVEIVGEIKYEGVMSETADDGKISYAPIKYSAPFKKNVNINCQNCENIELEALVQPKSASAVIDGENIIFSSEIEAYITALLPKCLKRLSSLGAKADEPYRTTASVVNVYYPTVGDSLFSVAKRFHTTPERIAEDNALDVRASLDGETDGISGVKRLFIY